MSNTLIIVEKEADIEPYFSSENVLTFEQYVAYQYLHLSELKNERHARLRIINLCKSNSYLSIGYYCSLLAEARGHSVIPSVRTLNDLSQDDLTEIELSFLPASFTNKLLKNIPALSQGEVICFKSFFGQSYVNQYAELTRKVFQHFPCPIVEITLSFDKVWQVQSIKTISPDMLTDVEDNSFSIALEDFCHKVWRKKRNEKSYRYDLAILVDPKEKLPSSDHKALKKFITAGKVLNIGCELITKDDYHRLSEYDALFIRTTTAIDHYSYRFAKKAEMEGLVVIDDPTSILRCTNKIYLADLFSSNNVKAPKTQLLFINDATNVEKLEREFSYPMVLKIPDGAFSIGVEKVKNNSELIAALSRLFTRSSLLIAQEYLYTEFDWRIGILNGKPIFACRYYMVNNHWQIYQHSTNKVDSGSFETLPTFEAPKWVLESAIKATNPIGNGFYGVDVKEKDGIGYVIEVNDNPSIDSGVEDLYLGNELYQIIMSEFLTRMEKKRNTTTYKSNHG
jgi:glutathione synthase/RimK-type ligase-like ATP-grasp enzyme